MTDDVTLGLELLADEAEPAPIDTNSVVAMARARTRSRRAVTASAFVTVAAVGALTVTVGALKDPATTGDRATTTTVTMTEPPPSVSFVPPASRQGPVLGTEVEQPATPAERAERADRLQGELTGAFDRVLGDGWEYSTFRFACDEFGCWAQGDIVDETGPVNLFVHVSGDYGMSSCLGSGCVKEVLGDGTLVALSENPLNGTPGKGVASVRTDGTSLSLSAEWEMGRETPPLTDEQWREFGNALTY